ncbi:unnamed protein product [Spirodela intermedia]|uniref:FAD-binding PCMH-type domain-containing protein n=1 Tax=Spirodela intermedia TaxID=51605 RepID=A0A7I8IJZ9_SPIIN|nr:unnamed protein product [Spirodela intermedia]CAA6657700.1 unnamed protein product [Spirodela intermedia]
MKVVTVYSHSIPKLSCPGGPAGAGLAISTDLLSKVVSVDLASNRMTFEAGITLRQLLDAAAARGLALPTLPTGRESPWRNARDGLPRQLALRKGIRGARKGSGNEAGSPSPYPINGYRAKVVELVEGDEDLLAAKVSLGVLGVISQVTLQLEPTFKRSVTNRVERDIGFERTISTFAAATEFGDIIWYPAQAKVTYRDDVRLPISASGEGTNDFIGFRPQPSLIMVGNRATEELLEATGDSRGKCLLSKLQVTTLQETGGGLRNNDGSVLEFTGYPVVGNQSDMQTSGSCLTSGEDGLLTPSIAACLASRRRCIPLTDIASFIAEVKKLRDLRPSAFCGIELYYGFLMRFVRSSTAYLGKTADSVDIDITYYRSTSLAPRGWTKTCWRRSSRWQSERRVPQRAREAGAKATSSGAMTKYDRDGLFSSDWTDAVLGLAGKSPVNAGKGCALEGMCICSLDLHCEPDKGYYCKPGLVFPQARVCRKTGLLH